MCVTSQPGCRHSGEEPAPYSDWTNWHRARPEHSCDAAASTLTRDTPGHRTPALTQINAHPRSLEDPTVTCRLPKTALLNTLLDPGELVEGLLGADLGYVQIAVGVEPQSVRASGPLARAVSLGAPSPYDLTV